MVRPVNAIIVGAAKSGTTSLLNYLSQHPSLCTHKQPEFNYFRDFEYHRGYKAAFEKYFGRCFEAQVLLAKCAGLMYYPEGLERLYQHNSKVQVIAILRNPIARAYSQYWFNLAEGVEKALTFEEAIEKGSSPLAERWFEDFLTYPYPYLKHGIYHEYVEKIYNLFGKENLEIVILEDLKQNPDQVVKKIFAKLNLDTEFKPETFKRHNIAVAPRSNLIAFTTRRFLARDNFVKQIGRTILPNFLVNKFSYQVRQALYKINKKEINIPEMNPETKKYLVDYFIPHNDKLSELLGVDLSFWNK